MEKLYINVGFIDEYYQETTRFFMKYYLEDEMYSFFNRVFKNDAQDKTPRRMMNQIVRWGSLAEDLRRIRPDRDPLVIMCIRACIESICKMSKNEIDKTSFFENYLTKEEMRYIDNSFGIVEITDTETGEELYRDKSKIQDFDEMIFRIRNAAVHDGDYWTSQVFSKSKDIGWFSNYLEWRAEDRVLKVAYETTLEYDEFMKLFVRASVRCIDSYIYKNNSPGWEDNE